MEKITEVAAALIWAKKEDVDRFLICQRPNNKARGLLWEFPGGKLEQGETLKDCLIRECREELDIILSIGEVFMSVIHEYTDLKIQLTVFNAGISGGIVRLKEHADARWITEGEINSYEFCPADKEILKKIESLYNSVERNRYNGQKNINDGSRR